VVEALLAAGASPAATDDAGYTPLHLAAERGDLPIVRLLLLARAEVDVFIGETTPMDLARRGRHGQVVGLLRQMGAR
jgi:ankyrin repeat protein